MGRLEVPFGSLTAAFGLSKLRWRNWTTECSGENRTSLEELMELESTRGGAEFQLGPKRLSVATRIALGLWSSNNMEYGIVLARSTLWGEMVTGPRSAGAESSRRKKRMESSPRGQYISASMENGVVLLEELGQWHEQRRNHRQRCFRQKESSRWIWYSERKEAASRRGKEARGWRQY